MASHIPLVEDDHVIGLDGKPLAPLPVNAWAGLPFEVHPHMQKGEVAHRYNPHPLLLVRLRTHGRSRIRSGHSVYDLALAPGQVDVFSTGFRMDHGWWDCTPGDVLAVELDPERVHAALGEETESIEVTTRLSVRDPVLEALCTCMRREVDSGCMSGQLFAEACRSPCWRGCASATGRVRLGARARAASSRRVSCTKRSPSSTPTSAPTSASHRSRGRCR